MTQVFDENSFWWDDSDSDDTDDDEPPESYNLDFDECGFIPGEGCQLIGTEDCEFDCPYRDAYYKELDRIGNQQESRQHLLQE